VKSGMKRWKMNNPRNPLMREAKSLREKEFIWKK